jgi:cobalt-zinc-cadmium efflux system membrane fusion protein
MFARGRIALAGSGASILLPRIAVQEARGAHIVFVRLAEDLYETRHVRVGSADGDRVEVAGRIAPGDRIVTVGSFLLKTETLKGSIGAGCCEVEDGR